MQFKTIENLEDWEKSYPEMYKVIHDVIKEENLKDLIFCGVRRYSPLLRIGSFDIAVEGSLYRLGFTFTCNDDGTNLDYCTYEDDGRYFQYK